MRWQNTVCSPGILSINIKFDLMRTTALQYAFIYAEKLFMKKKQSCLVFVINNTVAQRAIFMNSYDLEKRKLRYTTLIFGEPIFSRKTYQ